jgi:hypothetical protein
MASTDDDSFIDSILDKQAAREGQSTPKGVKMSSNRKDMIKGPKGRLVPAITQEEANSITEWNNMKKAQAEFKNKHGLTHYSFDEIKQDGNKLTVDETAVKERNLTDNKLVQNMVKEDKNSGKGVAHYVSGESVVLRKPEDVESLKDNGEGKELE